MSLEAAGLIIALTYLFAFAPLVTGLIFFGYRRLTFPKFSVLLPATAIAAGLIQFVLSGPILDDEISSPIFRIFTTKTVDYNGYNLLAGLIIFSAIVICWQKSQPKKRKIELDKKLATYLIVITLALSFIQIIAARSYNNRHHLNSSKAFNEQVELAKQFGTPLYKIKGLLKNNIILDFGEFEQDTGGDIVYIQHYQNTNSSGVPLYSVTEINTLNKIIKDYPCTIDENTPSASPGIECRFIATVPNGFNVYAMYITSQFTYKTNLFKLFFQKDNSRIQIFGNGSTLNFSTDRIKELANSLVQIQPADAPINDFLYKN